MKLTIPRRAFADAVAFVARMSPKRPTQTILAGVLLRAAGESLTLTVYDYEIAAETTVTADVETDGTVLVHAAMLAQIAAKLPQKDVTIETIDPMVQIRCGSVRAELPLMPAEEYPSTTFDGREVATMSGAVFEDAIQRVAMATAQDAVKPIIMGVHTLVNETGATFTATDRYRISEMVVPCETGDSAELVIPGTVIREAAKAFGPSETVVLAVTERDGVTIRGDRGVMLTHTLVGEFPPVGRLFPKEPKAVAAVDREAAVDATSRAALALDPEGVVRYTFADGECRVLGASQSDGRGVSEVIDANTDSADEVMVPLRPQLVIDGLNACRAEAVTLWFTHEPTAPKPGPVMFTAGDGYRYLLQPNMLTK